MGPITTSPPPPPPPPLCNSPPPISASTASTAHHLSPHDRGPGLKIAETVKKEFDERWTPYWHVILGRNFGSFVTHETRCFLYFYIGDKAVMIYKAG